MMVEDTTISCTTQQLIVAFNHCRLQPMVTEIRMSFANRLDLALDHAGIVGGRQRKKAVATMFGVSREAVRKWLEGESLPDTKRIIEIARRLGVSAEWLLTGDGDMVSQSATLTSNVAEGPELHAPVPLISYVQAGWGAEAIDNLHPGDAEDWLPCPRKHSKFTYALKVRGDSMIPEYVEDDIVFVDPMLTPKNRDDVVVRNGDNEATLKRLVLEGDRKYLKALNRDYPDPIVLINEDHVFCGVVIFSGRYRG